MWVALNSPDNLWHGAKFETGFYYAPGWSQIADPKMSVDGDVYFFSLPQATTDQWQAQVLFKTNIATYADTPYDFCITLNACKAPERGHAGRYVGARLWWKPSQNRCYSEQDYYAKT